MIKNIITRIQASDPAQRRSGGNIFKFLAVLLALTLVARGTSGATLARVTLATPERSEIVDAITGSATVSATDTIDIQAPAGLKVAEMLVSVGQQVSAGDAVAVFDLDNLRDIHMRETAALHRLELDLERLERGETLDATSLENAQRTLARAQEDYSATVQQGEADIAEARENLDELLAAYGGAADATPAAILSHQRALEDFYATLAAGETDIAAAEAALGDMTADDTQWQTAIRNHQRAQEDYNATYAQGAADIAAAQTALAEAQTHTPDAADRSAIDNAQRNLQRARDDHNTTRRQGEDNIWNAEQALNTAVFNYQEAVLSSQLDPNPGAVAAARTAVEQAQNAVTNAQN
ncbi:MAG: efflux RND transporter periplasmic adaptor subunit, partial [Defluviitaleaceae bacterium]|nr:efflux RND transporter periplasmic adaptor subunit [Defluviitaleaceae bacterium]